MRFIFTCFLLTLTNVSFAATKVHGRLINGKMVKVNPEKDEVFVRNRFFVELTQPGMIAQEAALEKAGERSLNQFQYREKLRDIRENLKESIARLTVSKGKSPKILNEYDLVWSGIVLEADNEVLESVQKMDHVKAVHPIVRVHAANIGLDKKQHKTSSADVYLPELGIPDIWNAYGLRGLDQTIAVIDSGVDYTHPDLGGCYGPGCKVKGGYDLVNQINDPKDKMGNGTRVAGIIAGNGKKMGVAPEASILAYKVLDNYGVGSSDLVIRAVEMALDPNRDGILDDAVDVINLSFEGPGSSDDAIAVAVNFAARYSVVIAPAGNAPFCSRISSPAAAANVIAVAASNASAQILTSSCVGPAQDFSMKPDITAPGFNVMSTSLGGGYEAGRGTYVASPFVAGLASLILQKDKDAINQRSNRSEHVKRSLSRGVQRVSYNGAAADKSITDYFYGGKGLVNPSMIFSSGSGLGFQGSGMSEVFSVDQSNVALSYTLPLLGNAEAGHTYKIEFAHNLGSSAEVLVRPKEFTSSNKPNNLTLSYRQVATNLPPVSIYPYARGGILKIVDQQTNKAIELPIAFFRKSAIEFIYPSNDFYFETVSVVSKADRSSKIPGPFDSTHGLTSLKFWVEPGTYDVNAQSHSFKNGSEVSSLFYEKVDLNSPVTRKINASSFPYERTAKVHDINGLQARDAFGQWFFVANKKINSVYTTFPATLRTNFKLEKSDVLGHFEQGGVSHAFREELGFGNFRLPVSGYKQFELQPYLQGGVPASVTCSLLSFNLIASYTGFPDVHSHTKFATALGKDVASTIFNLTIPQKGDDCYRGDLVEAFFGFDEQGELAVRNQDFIKIKNVPSGTKLGRSVAIPTGKIRPSADYISLSPGRSTMSEGESARLNNLYQVIEESGNIIASGSSETGLIQNVKVPDDTAILKVVLYNPSKSVRVESQVNVSSSIDSHTAAHFDKFLFAKQGEGVEFILSCFEGKDPKVTLEVRKRDGGSWKSVLLSPMGSNTILRGVWTPEQSIDDYEFRAKILDPQYSESVVVEGSRFFE